MTDLTALAEGLTESEAEVAKAICRIQLAQAGQWGPRGIDKQTAKYWQDWRPEAHAAIEAIRSHLLKGNGDATA